MIVFRMRSLEETTSTNDEVKRAIEAGEPEGLAVRSRRQVAGYGRQGRTWTSPDGGLYCSLLLRPDVPPAQLPTLSLAVGLAVRRAAVVVAGPHAADLVLLKWPNDVVVACGAGGLAGLPGPSGADGVAGGAAGGPASDGIGVPALAPGASGAAGDGAFAKLCGISLETHAGGVCAGIGVNVLPVDGRADVGGKNAPAYLVDMAPQLADMPVADALARVADALLEAFGPLYDAWQRDGFAPLAAEFNEHASLNGRAVRIVNHAGEPVSAGTVRQVADDGRLALLGSDGRPLLVASGEAHIVGVS